MEPISTFNRKIFIASRFRNTINIWDTTNKKAIKTIRLKKKDHTYGINFRSDGQQFVSSYFSRIIRIFDLNSDKILKTIQIHSDKCRILAYSQNGYMLATSNEEEIHLWDLALGTLIGKWVGHTDRIVSMNFSPNSQHLVTSSRDGSLKIWDLKGQELDKATHKSTAQFASQSLFMPRLATIHDTKAYIWDTHNLKVLKTIDNGLPRIEASTLSPKGHLLALATQGNFIKIHNLLTDITIRIGTQHQKSTGLGITSMVFNLTETVLITGNSKGIIELWDLQTQSLLQSFQAHTGWVNSISIHQQGNLIATGSQDRSVKLWSLNFKEELLCTIPDHSNAIISLEFSPDGQTLAVGTGRLGFGNTITIYTVWQEETRPYKKHGNMPL